MEINERIAALVDGLDGYWFSEPRRLKGAYLWTVQDRETVLFSKNRTKGIGYLRIAAANTPSEPVHIVIVPNIHTVIPWGAKMAHGMLK
jgi:hypothetical protein